MTTEWEYQEFQSCQKGDVGIELIVQIVDPDGDSLNVQSATSMIIRLGGPDGTSEDFTAAFLTDGSDGQIVYTTQSGDLDEVGQYTIQGIITIDGAIKSTTVSVLQVLDNIPAPILPEP